MTGSYVSEGYITGAEILTKILFSIS
ncbi:hypothetical protein [Candidatus Pelagibacter sp.]